MSRTAEKAEMLTSEALTGRCVLKAKPEGRSVLKTEAEGWSVLTADSAIRVVGVVREPPLLRESL
jgi:hypothetical protein